MLRHSRRATLALAFFLALSGTVLAQGDDRGSDAERFFILMQGYAAPNFGGAGLSSTFDVAVADVGGGNPAALGSFDRTSAGLAYQLETSISEGYVAGIGYGPMNGIRPQSASVVLPLGAWVLGASYAQRYAAEMDFGSIPVQTAENPDIDPTVTWEASQFVRLETVTPQIAYRTTLASGTDVALGARLGLGLVQFESRIDDVEGTFSDWGMQLALGASYRRTGAYGLAAYYESRLRVAGEVTRSGGFAPTDAPTNPNEIPGGTSGRAFRAADAIPARLGFSVEVAARPNLHLGADVAWVRWKAAWDDGGGLKDQPEAAVWARRDLSPDALVSFGLLYRGRNRWDNGVLEGFGYSGRAIYMTAGGALTFDHLRLDAVVADSRLLSAENHRQTIVKAGASVRF